ncbi:MAG: CHASE4 domain-containing protein [Aminipila sp.]
MKLTKKLMRPVTAAFLLAAALFILLYRSALVTSLSGIEADRAAADSGRILSLIEGEADHLQAKAMDYSRWDSTYGFIEAPDGSYETSAFSDYSSFLKLGINQIVVSDLAGNVVLSRELGCSSEQLLGSEGGSALASEALALLQSGDRESLKGVMATAQGPLLIACEKVHNGGAGQAANGIFILAKYLDQDDVSRMGSAAGLDFTLEPYNAARDDGICTLRWQPGPCRPRKPGTHDELHTPPGHIRQPGLFHKAGPAQDPVGTGKLQHKHVPCVPQHRLCHLPGNSA